MSIPYNLVRVKVDEKAIAHNWNLLHSKGGQAIAVVKADAYGHGLLHTVRALEQAGCRRMAIGTVEEGVYLREKGFNGQIIALLGPLHKSDCEALIRHDILPFCSNLGQLEQLEEMRRLLSPDLHASIALKFDTGMRRLGFRHGELPALGKALAKAHGLRVEMVASHLATADMPEERDFVLEQARQFQAICQELEDFASFERCLANSAAILAYPDLHLDAQRPGIAMYGGNPFHNTALQEKGHGLKLAMHVEAPVLQVRELAPGESISYGRTWLARRSTKVAIVAAGYADAYSRGLSSNPERQAAMLLHGKRAPIIGRVCMQMTAVDISDATNTRVGDTATLLGGRSQEAIGVDELADWWGTISYEVFCMLGQNPRKD